MSVKSECMSTYMHDSEYERYMTILSPPLEGGEEEDANKKWNRYALYTFWKLNDGLILLASTDSELLEKVVIFLLNT